MGDLQHEWKYDGPNAKDALAQITFRYRKENNIHKSKVLSDEITAELKEKAEKYADAMSVPKGCEVCGVTFQKAQAMRLSQCPGSTHQYTESPNPLLEGRCHFCLKTQADH